MTQMMTALESCKYLFTQAKERIAEAMPLLHQIFKDGLWQKEYQSFGEFVDELGISRSYASKLITVWEHYAVQGGVSQLNEVDPERLYLALSLPGNAEERLEKARLLSRTELKSERAMKENGEEHECQRVCYCSICHKRMD